MKKKVLLYFPGYNNTIGGSESRFLSFVAYLQDKVDLTVAMRMRPDFDFLESQYGIHVDASKVKIALVKETGWRKVVGRILLCEDEMALRRLAKNYDVCISCHGPKDFGKPAYHFIHMLWSFDPEYAAEFGKYNLPSVGSGRWLIFYARKILRRILPFAPRLGRDIIRDRNEHCIPNSMYVKRMLEAHYKCSIGNVFYPPTRFVPCDGRVMRDMDVLYLGRIHPEKGIDAIIDIVCKVRAMTGNNIGLHIAGYLSDSDYCKNLKLRVNDLPWVRLVGELRGEAKKEFLARHSFAIHMLKDEAFGISVTEYVKAGVIPLVPKDSAPAEIVQDEDLAFSTLEEIPGMLAHLILGKEYLVCKRARLCERAVFWSQDTYCDRQKTLLDRIVER